MQVVHGILVSGVVEVVYLLSFVCSLCIVNDMIDGEKVQISRKNIRINICTKLGKR